MNKSILALTLSVIGMSVSHGQTIAAWNFESDSIATNNNPVADTNNTGGTAVADSIGMNIYATPNVGVTKDDVVLGVTSGSKSDTGANGVANGTNTWRVRGQAGSNGAANGWSSAAPIGTQGAQFFAPTTLFTSSTLSSVKVSFDWYSTTQGEANLEFAYTTDGGSTWHNLALTLGGSDTGLQVLTNTTSSKTVLGSYVSDNLSVNGSPAGQDWFTGLTATITDPSALGDSGFGIEMVNASTGTDNVSTQGTALNNSSGNWRFDNVTISGVQAVPEPSTYALILAGFVLLIGFQIRRSRS